MRAAQATDESDGRVGRAGAALATAAWAEYVELISRLERDRAAGLSGGAAIRAGVAQMSEHADSLDDRLVVQHRRLADLGVALRTPAPLDASDVRDDPEVPAPQLLRQVGEAIDEADAAADDAEEAGSVPALLPGSPALVRNGLVWSAAALAVLAVQAVLFLWSAEPNPLLVLVAVPLVGFLAGAAILRWGTAPRIRMTGRPRTALSARLGLVLCLGVGPLVVLVLMLQNVLTR